jgi:long-chain fatty acid transport protein
VLLIWLAAPLSQAHAQGFGVFEQGACAMARAGATVADGCGDGSSIYFNPANIVDNEGTVISLGATMVAAQGDYTSGITGEVSELQNDPIFVPHAYGTYRINDTFSAGLGIYVPYGLATEWKETFEGAFEGYDNGVEAIYIQPTVAYRINDRLTIGGGPIVTVSSVELNQRQDLAQQEVPGSQDPITGEPLLFSQLGVPHHTAFVDVKLKGEHALGFGANIGATYDLSDRFRFAARFTTPIKVTYDGTADFTQIRTDVILPDGTNIDAVLEQTQFSGGALRDQSVETEITFPAQLVLGVSVDATTDLTLMADYQWTSWSDLGRIPLNFEADELDTERELNYGNTNAFRLGANYDISEKLAARAGFLFNTAAAPDATVTPLLPENDRTHYTVGLGYRPVDAFEINAAYQYLGQADREGRVRDLRPGEEVESKTAINDGLYSFDAHLVGLTLTVHL